MHDFQVAQQRQHADPEAVALGESELPDPGAAEHVVSAQERLPPRETCLQRCVPTGNLGSRATPTAGGMVPETSLAEGGGSDLNNVG